MVVGFLCNYDIGESQKDFLMIWGLPKTGCQGLGVRVSQNYGGPQKKDYSVLGSILASLYFGKLP